MTMISRAAATMAAVVVSGFLFACGGGGDSYSLRINGPDAVATTQNFIFLSGEGFVPAGSTCPGGCEGLLPPPVFGTLGPHTLTWSNEANGQGGPMQLTWICNCGGSAPRWMISVPLERGANRITVAETDRDRSQQVVVTVTRN